jgi:hypothetical protein
MPQLINQVKTRNKNICCRQENRRPIVEKRQKEYLVTGENNICCRQKTRRPIADRRQEDPL